MVKGTTLNLSREPIAAADRRCWRNRQPGFGHLHLQGRPTAREGWRQFHGHQCQPVLQRAGAHEVRAEHDDFADRLEEFHDGGDSDRRGPQEPVGQQFEIYSNNARNLLGTIYLPQGRLYVAANNPVSDQSAYTIVVARRFTLSEGPTMVLNTNYGATDIPVPNGVGPNISTQLTQ